MYYLTWLTNFMSVLSLIINESIGVGTKKRGAGILCLPWALKQSCPWHALQFAYQLLLDESFKNRRLGGLWANIFLMEELTMIRKFPKKRNFKDIIKRAML